MNILTASQVLKSKTFWLNVATLASLLSASNLPPDYIQLIATVSAVANVVLKVFFTQQVPNTDNSPKS